MEDYDGDIIASMSKMKHDIDSMESTLKNMRERRDTLIVSALEQKVSVAKISRTIGVSRQAIYSISKQSKE